MDHGDGKTARELVGELARAVGRVVVDDDELSVDAGGRVNVEDRAYELRQPVPLVVRRHDERERLCDGDTSYQGEGSAAL